MLYCRGTLKTKPMAFTEVNPATGKTWSRDDLWLAYQSESATVTELLGYQLQDANESSKARLVSWPDQLSNLQARWGIHLKEWHAVTKDVAELGRTFRGHLEELQEVVTAPVLKK